MYGQVRVIVKATGREAWVPPHFLDHPVFGPRYELPAKVPDQVPTAKSKKADIEAYAAARDIDLTGAKNRAEMVALIEDATAPDVVVEGDSEGEPDGGGEQ